MRDGRGRDARTSVLMEVVAPRCGYATAGSRGIFTALAMAGGGIFGACTFDPDSHADGGMGDGGGYFGEQAPKPSTVFGEVSDVDG